MKINSNEDPRASFHTRVWIDGVEVSAANSPYRYCYEADDEAGYIKCEPSIEVRPGVFQIDWDAVGRGDAVVHYGRVVIRAARVAS